MYDNNKDNNNNKVEAQEANKTKVAAQSQQTRNTGTV